MKPQHQTTFGGPDAPPEERGNCFAVAIASLLGVDAAHVPNFIRADDYIEETAAWMAERGLAIIGFETNPVAFVPQWRDRVTTIASGRSPRGDWEHAVLWRGGKLLHDPHPSGDGIVGAPTYYEVLVVIDPDDLRRWLEEARS
jgi:hypothetical protein